MKLKVKLYASLKPYLPTGAPRNQADIEISKGASVQSVLDGLNIPQGDYKLVLLNGIFITPEERATRGFVESDVLAVWPPVAGG